MSEMSDRFWLGYARANGTKGIRNRVLVIYTVKCAEFVAREIVRRCGSSDVELIGFDGCTDNQYAVRQIISLIRHPNVGAVLAVGLGCEYMQPEWLAKIARRRANRPKGSSFRTRAEPCPPSRPALSGRNPPWPR